MTPVSGRPEPLLGRPHEDREVPPMLPTTLNGAGAPDEAGTAEVGGTVERPLPHLRPEVTR